MPKRFVFIFENELSGQIIKSKISIFILTVIIIISDFIVNLKSYFYTGIAIGLQI
jgi:hypothetical protein